MTNQKLNEFEQALDKFSVVADELASSVVREKIQQYCVLLWHKNQHINLTRHTDWETFVSRDLIDTLELSKLIGPNLEVLDVGSGGGVPGLVLAMLRPDLEVSLAESVGKRAVILAEFAEVLGIHVQIYQERAEKIVNDFRFDVTTARAVGSISKLCNFFNGRWLNVNRMLATKGPNWINEKKEAELSKLTSEIEIQVQTEYLIPGSEWKSVILEMKPANNQ